jgi:hypothetical protein
MLNVVMLNVVAPLDLLYIPRNTMLLADLSAASVTKKKSFVICTPGDNVIILFTVVIYK